MEEKLVDRRVAKKLKQLGFHEEVYTYFPAYDDDTTRYVGCRAEVKADWNTDNGKELISHPTQAHAAMWIRKTYSICIVVYPTYRNDYGTEYRWKLFVCDFVNGYYTITEKVWFEVYEQAFEKAMVNALSLIEERKV